MSYYLNNGQNAIPAPGTIIAYLGTTFPDGWMLCDGQSIARSSFPHLANALGVDETNTSFNLPNLQGLFLRHRTTNLREIQEDTFKKHYHEYYYNTTTPGGSGNPAYRYNLTPASVQNFNTLTSGDTETRPYNYGVNWIIKTDWIVNVPGQPTILGVNLTVPLSNPGTTMNVNFEAPLGFDTNSTATSYQYSIDNGKTWTASSNLTNIPTPNYIKLRALNSSGNAGQASSVYVIQTGLNFKLYTGYFADNVTWFSTASLLSRPYPGTGGGNYSSGFTRTISDISSGTLGLIPTSGTTPVAFSVQWIGNFYADITGSWSFSIRSDDASYLWVGQNAISNFSTTNASINNGGTHGLITKTTILNLEQGYYPIRIQYGNNSSGYGMIFSFTRPGGTSTTDGTNYFYGLFPDQNNVFTSF